MPSKMLSDSCAAIGQRAVLRTFTYILFCIQFDMAYTPTNRLYVYVRISLLQVLCQLHVFGRLQGEMAKNRSFARQIGRS